MTARLRDLARARGVTDAEIATEMGLSRSRVRQLGERASTDSDPTSDAYRAAVDRLQPTPVPTAAELVALRLSLGGDLTQEDAAAALGCSARTIARAESPGSSVRARLILQRRWDAFFATPRKKGARRA